MKDTKERGTHLNLPISLISVMVGFKGPFHRNPEIIGLLLAKLSQANVQSIQMEASDFFVQLLRERVDFFLMRLLGQPIWAST